MAQTTSTEKSEYQVRKEKLHQIRQLDIDPYPTKAWEDRKDIFEIRSEVAAKLTKPQDQDDQEYSAAGRIRSIRVQGVLIFADIEDGTGKIQTLLKQEIIGEKKFEQFRGLIDVGDCLQVKGSLFVTKRGELTIEIHDFGILVKALRPLPDKWHGLEDIEKRFRERYLDMLANPEVKKRIIVRAKIIQTIRNIFLERGFLEVETPTLQPIYGGGFAKPFITHHNALDSDLYLRISSEMYLKRLTAGALDKVFEFSRVFRNEGVDLTHNPEFTMLEAQIAWEDYTYFMEMIEDMFAAISQELTGSTTITYQDHEVKLAKPWRRLKVIDGIKQETGINYHELKDLAQAKEKALEIGLNKEEVNKMTSIGALIGYIFEEKVESALIDPTFVYEYPVETSPLAKKCPEEDHFVERFEIFINGKEYGNNYTELNDPIDLKKRFVDEKNREKAGFLEIHQTDWDYLKMVEHGLPTNAGLGIGIDRVVMLFTDTNSIKEVIAFPTLRPQINTDRTDRSQK